MFILYVVSLVTLRQEALDWIKNTFSILLTCMIVTLIILLIVFIDRRHARKVPFNYLYMIGFTLSKTY